MIAVLIVTTVLMVCAAVRFGVPLFGDLPTDAPDPVRGDVEYGRRVAAGRVRGGQR